MVMVMVATRRRRSDDDDDDDVCICIYRDASKAFVTGDFNRPVSSDRHQADRRHIYL